MNRTTNRKAEKLFGNRAYKDFAENFKGEIVLPGDSDYDEARQVWNGLIDKRPALIARCAEVSDVQLAVLFARDQHLMVAVRGGGHSIPGQSTCDGGIVIDLSRMKSITVDLELQTVFVEGGATWGDVDEVTQTFGLAAPGGVVSTTGVAGLTLGGGYGWLRRKVGLSCDSLLSAQVVTADGQVLTASATENPDLLWGLKGGGGNFGVVVSFRFQLYPVGPQVMYASSMYAAKNAGQVLRKWRDFVENAPDEVTSDATIWTVPSIPEVPAELYGRQIVLVEAVYSGPAETGELVLQPLRDLDTPLLDMSEIVSYVELQSALDDLFPKGALNHYWKSSYLNHLNDDVIDAIVERAVQRPSPRTLVPIRHLGGAFSRIDAEATAFGDRSAPYLLSIDSSWDDPAFSQENIAWTRAFWADMQRFSNGATYFNFPGQLEEGLTSLEATFGANYKKLVALKNQYDSTNVFRLNHNIKPTV